MRIRLFPLTTDDPDRWRSRAEGRQALKLAEIRQRIDATLDVYNAHGRPVELKPVLDELRQKLLEAKQWHQEQAGQAMIEYAFMAALVVLLAFVLLTIFGNTLDSWFNHILNGL